jgi:hypothetical protein
MRSDLVHAQKGWLLLLGSITVLLLVFAYVPGPWHNDDSHCAVCAVGHQAILLACIVLFLGPTVVCTGRASRGARAYLPGTRAGAVRRRAPPLS